MAACPICKKRGIDIGKIVRRWYSCTCCGVSYSSRILTEADQAVIDGDLDAVEFVKAPLVSIGPSGIGGPYQKEIK